MRSARFLVVLPFLLLACGSKAPLHQPGDGGGDVGSEVGAEVSAPWADAPVTPIDLVTRDVPADRPDADASPADGPQCCEPGPAPASCLDLGGAKNKFGCFVTCDFYCSTNWRLELDDQGCPAWRMDYRKPALGENEVCFPDADASTPDASETRLDASETS